MLTKVTLITANHRLAKSLKLDFAENQLNAGNRVWEAPSIFALNTWLMEYWRELQLLADTELPLLLNAFQELTLWENIIKHSPYGQQLMEASDVAKVVKQTWGMCQQWNVNLDDESFNYTPDPRAFRDWGKIFQQQCQQEGWLSESELATVIQSAFEKETITPPERIAFVGFTEFPPYLKKLIETLTSKSVEIEHITNTVSKSKIQQIILQDEETEIHTVARWAKSQYELGHKKIGCVIPNLSSNRPLVEKIFKKAFPENQTNSIYNMSGGRSFTQYPIIYTAFKLLSLNQRKVSLEIVGSLLRSPYLQGGETEMCKRASLDVALRENGRLSIHLDTLIRYGNEKDSPHYCPKLADALEQYKNTLSTETLTANEWAKHFSQQLAILGWPGERALNSEEYQCTQRWLQLLDEFSHMDSVATSLTCSEALHHLKRLASDTLFQVETEDGPIQVLGMLEAVGMEFDRVWITGLTDDTWPPAPSPNPFIPASLQRGFSLPHSSAQREMEYCRQYTEILTQSANQVIVSSPQWEGDKPLRPSALIADFTPITLDELKLGPETSVDETLFASRDCEYLEDDFGPELGDNSTISGGTFVFKQQGACPFRAFAEFRLGAYGLGAPQLGFDAMERGIAIHSVLEKVWGELKTQAQLHQLPKEKIENIIEKAINQTLTAFQNGDDHDFNPLFLSIEKQRVHRIIERWLELEKTRPPFKVVATEARQKTTLGKLSFSMQVDRIDELEDGSKIIIDYKTGIPSINSWFDERPDEPQLPLYCLSSTEPIAGIAFAQVRTSEMKFKGITDLDYDIPNVIPIDYLKEDLDVYDWNGLLQSWQENLEILAKEFKQGYARVAPKDPGITCQYCELHSLCRIHEAI